MARTSRRMRMAVARMARTSAMGGGPQHAHHPVPGRQEHQAGDKEDDVPGQGQQGGLQGLAHGLQEDAAGLLDAAQQDAGQIHPEAQHGVLVIQVALTAEER